MNLRMPELCIELCNVQHVTCYAQMRKKIWAVSIALVILSCCQIMRGQSMCGQPMNPERVCCVTGNDTIGYYPPISYIPNQAHQLYSPLTASQCTNMRTGCYAMTGPCSEENDARALKLMAYLKERPQVARTHVIYFTGCGDQTAMLFPGRLSVLTKDSGKTNEGD